MTVRVEVVTGANEFAHLTCSCGVDCYGGMRTLVTEWPPEAIEAAANELIRRQFPGATPKAIDQLVESYSDREPFIEDAKAALAAAWGHITGDNK